MDRKYHDKQTGCSYDIRPEVRVEDRKEHPVIYLVIERLCLEDISSEFYSERYFTRDDTATAPSATAVTICLRSFVLTSPAA